jgi:hypothetical protein
MFSAVTPAAANLIWTGAGEPDARGFPPELKLSPRQWLVHRTAQKERAVPAATGAVHQLLSLHRSSL